MQQHMFAGSCHCGSVSFRVTTDLSDPVRCNCSFCEKRGTLLQKLHANHFEVVAGEQQLTRYGSRSFSDHYFCSTCGIHTFTRSTRNGESAVVVNVACLQDVDLTTIKPRIFNGAELL